LNGPLQENWFEAGSLIAPLISSKDAPIAFHDGSTLLQ